MVLFYFDYFYRSLTVQSGAHATSHVRVNLSLMNFQTRFSRNLNLKSEDRLPYFVLVSLVRVIRPRLVYVCVRILESF